MTPSVRLHQLYILRSQVDILIAMEEGVVLPDGAQPECPHPEDKRRNTTVMGGQPEYLCLVCGAVVKGVA